MFQTVPNVADARDDCLTCGDSASVEWDVDFGFIDHISGRVKYQSASRIPKGGHCCCNAAYRRMADVEIELHIGKMEDSMANGPDATTSQAIRSLEIFVLPGCHGFIAARRIADGLRAHKLPGLDVRIVDLAMPGAVRPSAVFAVPTYLLDGRMLCLGNPEPDWLRAQLAHPG